MSLISTPPLLSGMMSISVPDAASACCSRRTEVEEAHSRRVAAKTDRNVIVRLSSASSFGVTARRDGDGDCSERFTQLFYILFLDLEIKEDKKK